MPYDSLKYHRRSIRLQAYDYSQAGAYFVTICSQSRDCLLGEVVDEVMVLNPFGITVQDQWMNLPCHYPHIELDAFVVMPNHVHGIIVLSDETMGAGFKPSPTNPPDLANKPVENTRYSLSEIIRGFKTFSARQINVLRESPGVTVWQRNYYEQVIRSEKILNAIRQYIEDNPLRWMLDTDNPINLVKNPTGKL